MAPNLLGKHQTTVCSSCHFKIVSEVAASTKRFVICPNCGAQVDIKETNLEPPDLVNMTTGQLPERWQVIGFQRTGDNQASIKRVIGLPGEAVWFEHGNIFVQTKDSDPILLKKNWKQQKSTRVLIHDNRFQGRDSRWSLLESTSSLNTVLPKRFQTDLQWLRYQPKRCYEHLTAQRWSPRIEDAYGFNQSIRRQLNPVYEVCLEFEFDLESKSTQTGPTELLIAIIVGEQTYLARFELNVQSVDVQLFNRDNQLVAGNNWRIDQGLLLCGISNIDQQIIVAVGDQQTHLLDLPPQNVNSRVEVLLSLQPANPIDLKRVRLWRDTYYFSPILREELLRRQAGAGPAGTDGYFVVGDNLPVSQDSRSWPRPRVKAKDILGVVDIGQ